MTDLHTEIRELQDESSSSARKQKQTEALGKLKHAIEEHGIDLANLGNVKAVWVKTEKGDDGQDHVHGASILLAPSWESGPEWPLVNPAKPVKVSVPSAKKTVSIVGKWKTAAILPDPQYGYRQLPGGTMDPFHDERAIDVALQIVEAERPDLSIWLGDVLDFPMFGKYRQEPGFALTAQATLDRAHEDIAKVAALSQESRFIEGNHDVRLQNAIIDNAVAAFGLRQANTSGWPVLSVPNLLRLDELGVEYVPGYPVGVTHVNDNLCCIHGRKVKSSGSTANLVLDDERVSTIFGHVHRIETAYKTRNTRNGAKVSLAHTPGTLARIDGAVPGTNCGIDPLGKPVVHYQNWQQGLTIVRYEDGDGRFSLESIPIFDGWAMHRGLEFKTTTQVV